MNELSCSDMSAGYLMQSRNYVLSFTIVTGDMFTCLAVSSMIKMECDAGVWHLNLIRVIYIWDFLYIVFFSVLYRMLFFIRFVGLHYVHVGRGMSSMSSCSVTRTDLSLEIVKRQWAIWLASIEISSFDKLNAQCCH